MKFVHLSDMHFGKRVNEFSMIDEQKYIIEEILKIVDSEKPDAVLIAGDVYDKSVPSAEAVSLFDDFLFRLSKRKLAVFVISGNHDSAERIAFGSRLMNMSGIYMSPVYNGNVEPVSLEDEYGRVNFYMLPFIKPQNVRSIFPDEDITSYNDAVRTAVEKLNINKEERNVIITHQFVTGAATCDSEEKSVGGTDNIDAAVFEEFDYTALGHIHGPQNIGTERIRYCGSPLKYSFSEAGHHKSVTIAELHEIGQLSIRTAELIPLHDMRELKGTYAELTLKDNYFGTAVDDYLHITLTDEEDIPDAMSKLRIIYPNLMKIDYDNTRTRTVNKISGAVYAETKTPSQLFSELYERQNNQPMTDEQTEYINRLIAEITEGNI